MRRPVLLASLALATAFFASAAEPSAPLVHDTTPIRLFNGRNFDGLHVFAEPAVTDVSTIWKIEDGVLRALGVGKGYVRTTTAYADYHLRVEWRWPVRTGNSGVLLNIVGRDIIWPKCIEAQLAVNRAGEIAFFSDARATEEIVSRNPTGVSTGRLARPTIPTTEKAQGEWNVYDIVVAGDTITLSVNGTQINRITGVRPSGGMIAFQTEGTPIDFRNMELTPLPAAKNLNAPMPPR